MAHLITLEQEKSVEEEINHRREHLAYSYTRVIFGAALGASILFIILWVIFRQYIQILILAVGLCLMAGGAGLCLYFYRLNRAKLGIYITLCMSVLSIFIIFPTIPEMMLSFLGSYLLIVLFAYLYLGEAQGRPFSFAATACLGIDVLAIHFLLPRIPWQLSALPPIAGLLAQVSVVVIFFGVVFLFGKIVDWQDKAKKDLELTALELNQTMREEQSRRQGLETAVERLSNYLDEVGSGNLTDRISIKNDNGKAENDPLTQLGMRMNLTVTRLQGMIYQIREAASNLTLAANEILAATAQQASGASQQSAAITQTTSTVEEVKAISEQFIGRSQEVANASLQSANISHAGESIVEDTVHFMGQTKTQVASIAENILSLAERTQQIGEIINTVNEIASQSNILALNAAVEAARAGDQGKGFAVVAAEVRNLAEQSRQATGQVRTILLDIQKAINTTVMVTEEGSKVVDKGVAQAEQSGKVIQQLAGLVDEASLLATQMVAGGQQQATGIEQIATAMQNIKMATIQSLESTRQTERAAQELNQLSQKLLQVVAQYRL